MKSQKKPVGTWPALFWESQKQKFPRLAKISLMVRRIISNEKLIMNSYSERFLLIQARLNENSPWRKDFSQMREPTFCPTRFYVLHNLLFPKTFMNLNSSVDEIPKSIKLNIIFIKFSKNKVSKNWPKLTNWPTDLTKNWPDLTWPDQAIWKEQLTWPDLTRRSAGQLPTPARHVSLCLAKLA